MLPDERLLFLDEPGAALALESDHLVLHLPGRKDSPVKIPFSAISGIVIKGAASISSPVLIQCAQYGIPVSLLDYSGRLCSSVHAFSSDPSIREKQYHFFSLSQARLIAAKFFAGGKLRAQRRVLRNLRSNHPSEVLSVAIHRISAALRKVEDCDSIPSLRGVEGASAVAYWSAWSEFIPSFHGRGAHPAPDPVNAMLSFGYAILAHELSALAVSRKLDLTLSFLHESSGRYPSFVWDLIEPCRPVFVDRLVFSGFRRRRYSLSDVIRMEDGTVLLGSDSMKKFLSDFYASVSAPRSIPFSRIPLLQVIDSFIDFMERSIRDYA